MVENNVPLSNYSGDKGVVLHLGSAYQAIQPLGRGVLGNLLSDKTLVHRKRRTLCTYAAGRGLLPGNSSNFGSRV